MHREKDTALRLKHEQSSSSISSMLLNQPFQGPNCSRCGGYSIQWTVSKPPNVLLVQHSHFTKNHAQNDTMISFPRRLQHPYIDNYKNIIYIYIYQNNVPSTSSRLLYPTTVVPSAGITKPSFVAAWIGLNAMMQLSSV